MVKKPASTAAGNKISDINSLPTTFALTAVENEITDISSLVKKQITIDHNHDKYITTPEFNTMAASVCNASLPAQTHLIKKTEFDAKLKAISDGVTENKRLTF